MEDDRRVHHRTMARRRVHTVLPTVVLTLFALGALTACTDDAESSGGSAQSQSEPSTTVSSSSSAMALPTPSTSVPAEDSEGASGTASPTSATDSATAAGLPEGAYPGAGGAAPSDAIVFEPNVTPVDDTLPDMIVMQSPSGNITCYLSSTMAGCGLGEAADDATIPEVDDPIGAQIPGAGSPTRANTVDFGTVDGQDNPTDPMT